MERLGALAGWRPRALLQASRSGVPRSGDGGGCQRCRAAITPPPHAHTARRLYEEAAAEGEEWSEEEGEEGGDEGVEEWGPLVPLPELAGLVAGVFQQHPMPDALQAHLMQLLMGQLLAPAAAPAAQPQQPPAPVDPAAAAAFVAGPHWQQMQALAAADGPLAGPLQAFVQHVQAAAAPQPPLQPQQPPQQQQQQGGAAAPPLGGGDDDEEFFPGGDAGAY